MFRELQLLEVIENADKLDVSNVTNMESMFQVTWRLREIDVSNWDTSNVTNMRLMFGNLAATPAAFTRLDLASWDTSSVTDMSQMFMNAQSLTTLDLRAWDTSNVTDMSDMFLQANSLTTLDLGTWNTSKVTNMSRMFNLTRSLTRLNLSSWDTSSVTNMSQIFNNTNLKSLTLGENSLFSADTQLPAIQQTDGYTGGWKLEPGTENLGIRYASSSEFMTSYDGRFPGTYTWEIFEMWGSVPWLYDGISETIILYGGEAGAVATAPWKTYPSVKKILVNDCVTLPRNSSFLFDGLAELESIENADKFDVSQVTDMRFMFSQVRALNILDVSSWDTSQVTNMRAMFQNANALKKIDVSNWDTSQVTDMAFMFTQASDLEEIDVSNWNTSSLLSTQTMFNNVNLEEQYTGRWTLEENLSGDGSVITFENSTEFMANYDGSSPGTYIWERVAPEQLVASIDRVSDQSQTITGYATESVDELTISYQTTSGDKVVLEKDDPRIVWGDYQESNQQVRQFQIDSIGNERLETETKVTITVSKPSVETTGDRTEEQTVIKGINYRANNFTLDRFKINELSTQEELDALILQESRAQAANVLTEADMTDDFRIVETDLTREVDEDGSYFAVLEVGNKAYQMTIGIDVTSKLEHMRVTIPTKMVFESLYNTAESNRNFESQAYEIRNQSPLAVDTYINQLAIDDHAGIVLLEEGEDPLDYAESESEEEDPTLTYDDISTPLLRLNLKTEETQIQLYEAMEEQHLVRLEERSRVPISLTGDFYGDYPQWVVDSEADQGGYYEDLLVPNYRIVLRFVPRD